MGSPSTTIRGGAALRTLTPTGGHATIEARATVSASTTIRGGAALRTLTPIGRQAAIGHWAAASGSAAVSPRTAVEPESALRLHTTLGGPGAIGCGLPPDRRTSARRRIRTD